MPSRLCKAFAHGSVSGAYQHMQESGTQQIKIRRMEGGREIRTPLVKCSAQQMGGATSGSTALSQYMSSARHRLMSVQKHSDERVVRTL